MFRHLYPALLLTALSLAGVAGMPPSAHAQTTGPDSVTVAADSDSTAVAAGSDSVAVAADSEAVMLAEPPQNWFNLDEQENRFRGVSTERAYHELLDGQRPRKSVVVAVIDGGVDVTHDDLDDRIWTNPGEIPGNGVDDDRNGYTDDVHGWNFIGGADGRDVNYDTMELTREYARLRARYEKSDSSTVPPDTLEEFEYYLKIKADFEAEREETARQLAQIGQAEAGIQEAT
ncbi:MAG TPA: peptidase S8, partial [Rhodothermales bacterium]|nr:peptidase S8 [Rhodothermales bacterium]